MPEGACYGCRSFRTPEMRPSIFPPAWLCPSTEPEMVQYGIMDNTTLLGMAAGALTTIAYLPQVIKVWKTRSTHDISMGMFITLCLGLVMWTFYGLSINSMPVIIANIISFVLAFTVLVFKIRQG